MLPIVHKLLIVLYVLMPVSAVVVDVIRCRKSGKSFPSGGMVVSLAASVMMGGGIVAIYALGAPSRISVMQVALASYFAAGMLMVLKLLDWSLKSAVEAVLKRLRARQSRPVIRASFAAGGTLLRILILFGLGLPYVMSVVMVYRPRMMPADDPKSQLGFGFERVSFDSTDGDRVVGWWLPAIASPKGRSPAHPEFGKRTVVVCHGLASSKSNQLIMARALVTSGYNVLIFDFRAHGESAGQLCSFGDLERRDVLGAVRWLMQNKPQEARTIYGLGASMGGAALISAAADSSAEGRAIAAIAVYATYDDLGAELRSISHDRFVPPLRWLVQNLGLPIASAHVGANLSSYAPAADIGRLWPRPVLVVHGTRDAVIPFERGLRLYQQATQPREKLWVDGAGHNDLLEDEKTARQVREFFDNAASVPII